MMSEIEKLKEQARKAWLDYQMAMDGIDCGHFLLQFIRPGAREAAKRFDAVMKRLKEIDPACPKNFSIIERIS